MTTSKYTSLEYKARYFIQGDLSVSPKWVVLAFHGYGQLGAYFIKHFREIDGSILVVIPEGLHHFYLNGTAGRVGASWMTKEDRLVDIGNQSSYINSVLSDLNLNIEKTNLIVLGFSQGVSTAIRWIVNNQVKVNTFISWAGSLPLDLEENVVKKHLSPSNFINVIGDEDPYFDSDARKAVQEWLSLHTIDFKSVKFKGKHQLDPLLLKELITEITVS